VGIKKKWKTGKKRLKSRAKNNAKIRETSQEDVRDHANPVTLKIKKHHIPNNLERRANACTINPSFSFRMLN